MLKRKLLLTSWIAQNLLLVRKVLCRLVLKIISNVCAFKFFFKLNSKYFHSIQAINVLIVHMVMMNDHVHHLNKNQINNNMVVYIHIQDNNNNNIMMDIHINNKVDNILIKHNNIDKVIQD